MGDQPRLESVVPGAPIVDLTDPELSIPASAAAVWITRAEPAGVLHGVWIESGVDWSECVDGDVIATLDACSEHDARREGLHVALCLVHDRVVLPLGVWCDLAITQLAETIGPPASTVIALHGELEKAGVVCAEHPSDW
ncbi:MAG TPA: hypothetical protein VL551_34170 [Actinospica sp.]|jgi:hypothetical protein|nr:hypothetical protein [Actinospica sp.]